MVKQKSTSRAASQEAEEENELEAVKLDPIIKGLLERLPAPGDYWPKAERQKWLNILSNVLDLIYLEPESPAGG